MLSKPVLVFCKLSKGMLDILTGGLVTISGVICWYTTSPNFPIIAEKTQV